MAEVPQCEHRRVELGRLFCDIASRRSERATNETFNVTCKLCRVATMRAAHPCAHLDVGVELTEHRERSTLDAYHLACRVKRISVDDAAGCTPECPHFELVEEEKRLQYEIGAKAREDSEAAETLRRSGRSLDL